MKCVFIKKGGYRSPERVQMHSVIQIPAWCDSCYLPGTTTCLDIAIVCIDIDDTNKSRSLKHFSSGCGDRCKT